MNSAKKFEIEDEAFDQRNSDNIKGKLAEKIAQNCPNLFEKCAKSENHFSAKAIQDEKLAKKEKKRLRKERKEKERTNGEFLENGIKHKKHKKEKKEERKAEKERRKAERAEKRRRRESRELEGQSLDFIKITTKMYFIRFLFILYNFFHYK